MAKRPATSSKPKRERNVVAICLQPGEADELQACADLEARPLSSFIRLLALRGLVEYKRDPRAILDFKPH